jgi:hypothetical protein
MAVEYISMEQTLKYRTAKINFPSPSKKNSLVLAVN